MAVTQAVKLALIDNSVDPDSYPPCAQWGEFLSVPFDSFRARDGRLPDLGDGYTHLILTGSEASILERSGVFRSIPKYRSSGGGSCSGISPIAARCGGPCSKPASRESPGIRG
ncbi:MAG: hypothetical protein MUQ00_03405 [Candidatus Aminicenantes bacterium]|nr:hypothetical protein [Candidatus Aminicenantes bacterium]